MSQEFTTPVGRIVWGHPMKARPKTNRQTKAPLLDKEGKPRNAFEFGVAFPRAEFEQYVLPWLKQEAATVFPQGVPRDFAWKYTDGDRDMDDKNKPYSLREGYAGHYVLKVSTEAYCPEVYKNENGAYRKLEAHEIECGYYVALKLKVAFNQSQQSPGLYINPQAIDLAGYGAIIVSSGVDPNEAFGGRTYQLPPGASAVPMAMPNSPVQQPPQQYAPAAPAAPAYQQPPQQYAPAAPAAPVYQQPQGYPAPAHDFVQNVTAPQGYPVQQPPQQYAPAAPAAPAYQQPQGYPAPAAPGNAAPPAVAYPQSPTVTHAPAPSGYATPATTYPSNVPPGYPAR